MCLKLLVFMWAVKVTSCHPDCFLFFFLGVKFIITCSFAFSIWRDFIKLYWFLQDRLGSLSLLQHCDVLMDVFGDSRFIILIRANEQRALQGNLPYLLKEDKLSASKIHHLFLRPFNSPAEAYPSQVKSVFREGHWLLPLKQVTLPQF